MPSTSRDLAAGAVLGTVSATILVALAEPLGAASARPAFVAVAPAMLVAAAVAGRLRGPAPLAAQIMRFVLVGVGNTLVDLAVLTLGLAASGAHGAAAFAGLKALAFVVAMLHGFAWSRGYTFAADAPPAAPRRPPARELAAFAAVSGLALGGNVAVATAVAALSPPAFLPATAWPSVAALAGAAAALGVSFAGYRSFVFADRRPAGPAATVRGAGRFR